MDLLRLLVVRSWLLFNKVCPSLMLNSMTSVSMRPLWKFSISSTERVESAVGGWRPAEDYWAGLSWSHLSLNSRLTEKYTDGVSSSPVATQNNNVTHNQSGDSLLLMELQLISITASATVCLLLSDNLYKLKKLESHQLDMKTIYKSARSLIKVPVTVILLW